MTSPAFVLVGWPLVSTPAISTTPLFNGPRLPIQTSSLPSILRRHGMSTAPLPLNPSGEGWEPSGRIMLMTPVLLG